MWKNEVLLPTFSGLIINILNADEKDISYKDISHAQSNICRFGGQCKFNYSVGLHTLYGLKKVSNIDIAKEWFFHDAAEAYLGDIIRPVKKLIEQFELIETRLLCSIYKKYNINFTCMSKETIEIDNRMLLTEAKRLYDDSGYQLFVCNFSKSIDTNLLNAYDDIYVKEFEPRFVEYALDDIFDILILKGNFKDAKNYIKTLRI